MCMRACKSVLSVRKDSQTFSSFATQNPRFARPAFSVESQATPNIHVRPPSCGYALRVRGGDEEDRTPDPLLARQVLSQLSYTPIWCFVFSCVRVFSSFASQNPRFARPAFSVESQATPNASVRLPSCRYVLRVRAHSKMNSVV